MTKSIKSCVIALVIALFVTTSCKKDNIISKDSATFTIVNAIVGSNGFYTDFNGTGNSKTTDTLKWFRYTLPVNSNNFKEFNSYTGQTNLSLFDYLDTLHSIFKGTFDLPTGSIHSLFVTGTLAHTDSLFTTDSPPYYPISDSSIGIRFVNLSTGSSPVSVNIQGQPNGSEVSNLSYKKITNFKKYLATANISYYTFEFRDAANNTLLTTYTLSGIDDGIVNPNPNLVRFRNFTIVLQGLPSAQSAFLVNNSY